MMAQGVAREPRNTTPDITDWDMRFGRAGCSGGFMYSPTMSRTFSINSGSFDSLNVSLRCGWSPNARQICCTVVRPRPLALALPRLLQWVAPRGVASRVRTMTSSTCSSVTRRGAPGRGSSYKPSSRSRTNRPRHLQTVVCDTRSRFATSVLSCPSAHARMIRARRARCGGLGADGSPQYAVFTTLSTGIQTVQELVASIGDSCILRRMAGQACPREPREGASEMTDYVIRGGEEGRARLRVISQALWPSTLNLLVRAGITPGMACLDVGCGGGDVTLEMARIVGPSGSATGMDMDHTKVQLAQEDAESSGITNVEFVGQDIDRLEYEDDYDLVYARLLLTHLPDPTAALQRLVKATKPGGVVAIEDMDHSGIFSYPASRSLAEHVRLYDQVVRLRGADPQIGPKLPGFFRELGLREVQFAHVQPAFIAGDAKRIHQITLENIAPALIASGLATEGEIQRLSTELADFAQNMETVVSFPRIFQVCAYRA